MTDEFQIAERFRILLSGKIQDGFGVVPGSVSPITRSPDPQITRFFV